MSNTPSRRILVVDDMESIQNDFAKALAPPKVDGLADLEGELFGDAPVAQPEAPRFDLSFASQGLQAVAMVQKAFDEGRPYAMAFVDVRMPPGLDGIETIVRLWAVDPRLEVVICTAYSDYTWQQMLEKLKRSGQFLVLGKPFDGTVVRQMALGLTEKWNLARAVEDSHASLESQVAVRTQQLSDANQRLRTESQERSELERRLQHAQKLEALGRLVAGVAHEINNPLAFVLSNLDHLKLELEDMGEAIGTQVGELVEVARETHEGGRRIQQIVADLKAFSRTESRQMERVDLKRTMEFSLKMARHVFPTGMVVSLNAEDGLPSVRAASGPLSQVFLNLATNAAHAMANVPLERRALSIGITAQSDQQVAVTVRDQGAGISAENLGRLFEPFFTTRLLRGGTGLGLSICHGIVRELGGEIRVESKEDVGTTFTVLLPIARRDADTAPVEAAA